MFKKIIAILIPQREPVLTSQVVVLKNSETELWDVFADLLNMFFICYFVPLLPILWLYQGNSLSHQKLITVFLSIFNSNFTRNLITKDSQSPNVMPCIYINLWLKGDWEPHVGKNNVFQNVGKPHLWFLFKNVGERPITKSYCCISLLSVFRKILVKLVNSRLVDHIKKYVFFYFLVWLHVSLFEGICFDSSIWKKC